MHKLVAWLASLAFAETCHAWLQPQSSPALTMDRYLPQKLQDEAAAAMAARQAAAAQNYQENPTAARPERPPAAKPERHQERGIALQSRPSSVPTPPPHVAMPILAPAPATQPYITPMPTGIKPKRSSISQQNAGQDSRTAQASAKAYKQPIEGGVDIGQVQQGMEGLAIDGAGRDGDDDLEAPSSFCCPITTVSAC